jgi:hypothetical protein
MGGGCNNKIIEAFARSTHCNCHSRKQIVAYAAASLAESCVRQNRKPPPTPVLRMEADDVRHKMRRRVKATVKHIEPCHSSGQCSFAAGLSMNMKNKTELGHASQPHRYPEI